MGGLELKKYQRESLDVIARFSDAVRAAVDSGERRPVHDAYHAATSRSFIEVPQLPNTPYVCLRVPTGGGKTLIAAHALGVIAKRLGHQDRPLCLWVTPGITIRDQTLRGLRNREHPYHLAVRESLGGRPEVLTMEEALATRRAMLSNNAVIVVTTIQSYRIRNEKGEEDEATRKVYEDNGYLMDHFSNLPAWVRQQLQCADGDRVALSLANVMKLRGPIVIMDEAHNARTEVSFESLVRFGPLAVLELTATPQQEHAPARGEYASNVLHAVSALQLKREGMIRMPVELESRDNWLDVLVATVQRREALAIRAEAYCRQSGRFIRPIALIQAQHKSKTRETHTVDAVRQALIEQLDVPPERIRIATGDQKELDGVDLRARECMVEYVITMEALREGWDCPFAYVLGSVGNVATETAVEQLLGRVLRMPDATATGVPELDRAYAIVQSPDVIETAKKLRDGLVQWCGFDEDSVRDAFRVHQDSEPLGLLPVAVIRLSAPPDVSHLSLAVRAKVEYDSESSILHVHEPLERLETVALRDSVAAPADKAAVEEYWQSQRLTGSAPKRLDQYAAPVRVPQLVVRDGDRSYLFEPHELEEFAWNLDGCDTSIPDEEFSVGLNLGHQATLDFQDDRGGVRIRGIREVIVRQLSFVAEKDDWSKVELVRWLDAEVHRGGTLIGLPKPECDAWLSRVLDYLLTKRGADLRILVRKRHRLADVARGRILDHGRRQVLVAANMLFAKQGDHRVETSIEMPRILREEDYCPHRQYRGGPYSYAKHAFDLIGGMDSGEEANCAERIDIHPNVERWLRNLDQESAGGLSLPKSPGRFFPDFIVELRDGRVGLVEYKGRHLATNEEEQHKKDIGELWEARSAGTCVFVWVVDRDWAELKKRLAPKL